MGFLSRLRAALGGSRPLPPTRAASARLPAEPAGAARAGGAPRKKRNAVVTDGWLTLSSPHFFGLAHPSPNKRWVVGRFEAPRNAPSSAVVLVDLPDDRLMHQLTSFPRPFDAAVSDTGAYVVHDAGLGSGLQGDVVGISSDGRERYRRRYSANVYNIGISKCGRFAAVQTANAQSDDGNRLEVLDSERGCPVFSVQPASGWADAYSFDVDADGGLKALVVEHKALGRFQYSAAGEFKDAKRFQGARLDKGEKESRISAARDLLEADPSAADAAVALLAAFNQALELNSKVGIRKRATELRKKLAAA